MKKKWIEISASTQSSTNEKITEMVFNSTHTLRQPHRNFFLSCKHFDFQDVIAQITTNDYRIHCQHSQFHLYYDFRHSIVRISFVCGSFRPIQLAPAIKWSLQKINRIEPIVFFGLPLYEPCEFYVPYRFRETALTQFFTLDLASDLFDLWPSYRWRELDLQFLLNTWIRFTNIRYMWWTFSFCSEFLNYKKKFLGIVFMHFYFSNSHIDIFMVLWFPSNFHCQKMNSWKESVFWKYAPDALERWMHPIWEE